MWISYTVGSMISKLFFPFRLWAKRVVCPFTVGETSLKVFVLSVAGGLSPFLLYSPELHMFSISYL